MLQRFALLNARNLSKTLIRSGHSHGGIPGENLPFDIYNRTKFLLVFTAYVASGVGAPFLIVRHQLLKG